jgi:predicted  nucleic acid-binding Zn-ribbon protein
VDQQLRILIDLQALDTRIAVIEAEVARLPREIAAVHAAIEAARTEAEGIKASLDATRKQTRAREKDLEVTQARRTKVESRLYEVKTNTEYTAVLAEIEGVKQEKSRVEEDILTLMERQERLLLEIREAEGRLRACQDEGGRDEAAMRERLRGLEVDLAALGSERSELTRQLPAPVLVNYQRILRARSGLAIVPIVKPNLCAGCRMTVTPQRIQELRQQSALIPCESCGRFLYWMP